MNESDQKSDIPELELDDEDCVDMVCKHKEDSVKFYEKQFQKFNRFDKLYFEGSCKSNVPVGRANLKLPIAFQQVQPFVDQITDIFLAETPYIEYKAEEEGAEEAAEKITEVVQNQLESGGFELTFNNICTSTGKYGTSIAKVVWDTETIPFEVEETQQKISVDPTTGLPVVEEVTVSTLTEEKVFDGIRTFEVSVYDFFVPKYANTYDVQKFPVIHRVWRSLEKLLANPNYKNKEYIRYLLECDHDDDESITPKSEPMSKDTRRYFSGSPSDDGAKKNSDEIEVLEWWGDYALDSEDEMSDGEEKKKRKTKKQPALITVALVKGEKVLLRKDPNPLKYKFKPFIAQPCYVRQGEFYGFGELDHVESMIGESTALRNARLDQVNMSLSPAWLVERMAGFNIRELYFAPNKVLLGNDINGIRRLDPPVPNGTSIQEIGQIDFDIQNTTEIINPRQSASRMGAAFGGTARGVDYMSARTNLRMLSKARLFQWIFFRQLAMICLWYLRDIVGSSNTPLKVESSREDKQIFLTVPPEAFLAPVKYKASSAPDKLSRDQRRQNIEYLMQVIAQYLKVRPSAQINDNLMLQEMLKVAGIQHPERFIQQGPTNIIQMPDGSLIDEKQNPVQVIPAEQLMQQQQNAQ